MHGHRFAATLVLTAAILVPLGVQAAARTVQIRLYDRTHKDYHVWDNRENQTYRQHLTDQHKKYRAFSKQSHRQQNAYWNWRHAHSDDR
jgi:type III secretory pathway component EscR